MTVWAGGDVITSVWLNSVELILSAATYSANRITLTANQTHNLNGAGAAGTTVASNFILPASSTIAVATAKFNYTFGLWPVVSVTGTAGYRGYSWEATVTTSGVASEANGVVASGTVSGDGILKSIYGRAIAANGFTGTIVGVVAAVTSNATTGTATGLQIDAQGTNASHGIWFTSGTPGTDAGWGMLVDTNIKINNACFANVQASGSTADFARYISSGSSTLWSVDYLGNLNFKPSGTALTVGQRITGDLDNATLAKRVLFQTATAGAGSSVGVIPNATGTGSSFTAFGLPDTANSSKLNIVCNSAASATITITKAGTGTQNGLGIVIGATPVFTMSAVFDVFLGMSGAAAADTAGHHFIQAVAGAPTGVPGGASAGYVAIRYDSTNDFLYVYNGAWKKSTVYA